MVCTRGVESCAGERHGGGGGGERRGSGRGGSDPDEQVREREELLKACVEVQSACLLSKLNPSTGTSNASPMLNTELQ
jgi:hypothetical protein